MVFLALDSLQVADPASWFDPTKELARGRQRPSEGRQRRVWTGPATYSSSPPMCGSDLSIFPVMTAIRRPHHQARANRINHACLLDAELGRFPWPVPMSQLRPQGQSGDAGIPLSWSFPSWSSGSAMSRPIARCSCRHRAAPCQACLASSRAVDTLNFTAAIVPIFTIGLLFDAPPRQQRRRRSPPPPGSWG